MRRPALATVTLVLCLANTACPACEAELQGTCAEGVEFQDSPTIVPSQSPFSFCPEPPEPPRNRRFGALLLNNCGREPLEISDAEISADADGVFADLELVTSVVDPGRATALRWLYTSSDLLEHQGELTVRSNATNHPELKIALHVHADRPCDGRVCRYDGGSCPSILVPDGGE